MHHHRVHPVGHGEGFQVALDGDGQRQLVDEVHGGAGNDGSAAQVLQAEHCGEERADSQGRRGARLPSSYTSLCCAALAGQGRRANGNSTGALSRGTESFVLEETFQDHLVRLPCNEQGRLQLHQAAPA